MPKEKEKVKEQLNKVKCDHNYNFGTATRLNIDNGIIIAVILYCDKCGDNFIKLNRVRLEAEAGK